MHSRTFLYVEDEENDIFFMRKAIAAAGIRNQYVVLEDGREALDYLQGVGQYADRQQYPLPFLVLLDLKLPFVEGLEVLQWIRQQHQLSTMLVVVLTSSREDKDIDLAYRLGANSFLVKPPSAAKLQEMVKALGEYWFQFNEPPAGLSD